MRIALFICLLVSSIPGVALGSQWQERTAAVGYASSNLDVLHFGLGTLTEVPEVVVYWPDGRVRAVRGVKAGGVLTVPESVQ